jgi:hypothetical protein
VHTFHTLVDARKALNRRVPFKTVPQPRSWGQKYNSRIYEISIKPRLQNLLQAPAQMGHLVDSADAVRTVRHHGDMENISVRVRAPCLPMELFPPFFFAGRFATGLDACIILAVAILW